MDRGASTILVALVMMGSMSVCAFGQDAPPANPPPATPPPASGPEKEGSATKDPASAQDAGKPGDQEEQEKSPPEEDLKEADAPPESGDDIESHLKEAASDDAKVAGEKPSTGKQVPTTIEQVVKEEEDESGDNVSGNLRESRETQIGLFDHGPFTELYRLWKPKRDQLYADTGMDIGMAYTTLYQVATAGKSPLQGWGGDVDFFGKWVLVNKDATNTGSTGFLVEQRHRLTDISPNALNDNLGGLWKTTKGFGTQDAALVQLWWEQYLFEDHVKIVAGKLDSANFYNGNRFQSQNTFFLNQAFSSNPARAFPDNGLGVNVRLAPSDKMYFSFGAHDTNNTKTTSGFSNLDKDELFYAFEVGLTPRKESGARGRYRFTAWYTGAGDRTDGESGSGFALSFEQDLGNKLVPFFRYGYQDDNLVDTKQIVVGGLGILNPFGIENDVLGIGVAWGEPADSTLRDQYVAEVFFRHQVTPKIQFTPGFQAIFDPSMNPDDDFIGVFEFRFRVVF